MTRTEVVSSRPQATGAASVGQASNGDSARRGRSRFARRELLAVPAVLALMVPAAPAFAQTTTGTSSNGTSGYAQTAPAPKATPEAKKETAPAKEKTTPTTTTAPATTTPTTTPTTAVSPKASTLPFTGLNLTWVLGAGVLLLAAGLSIRFAQRRPGAGR
jgi:5'-nucleotidase/UDP-sugar diphosphatase